MRKYGDELNTSLHQKSHCTYSHVAPSYITRGVLSRWLKQVRQTLIPVYMLLCFMELQHVMSVLPGSSKKVSCQLTLLPQVTHLIGKQALIGRSLILTKGYFFAQRKGSIVVYRYRVGHYFHLIITSYNGFLMLCYVIPIVQGVTKAITSIPKPVLWSI